MSEAIHSNEPAARGRDSAQLMADVHGRTGSESSTTLPIASPRRASFHSSGDACAIRPGAPADAGIDPTTWRSQGGCDATTPVVQLAHAVGHGPPKVC